MHGLRRERFASVRGMLFTLTRSLEIVFLFLQEASPLGSAVSSSGLRGEEEWWAGPEGMSYADVAMFAALHGLEEIKPGAFVLPAFGPCRSSRL